MLPTPLSDENRTYVNIRITYYLIIINVLVFLLELTLSSSRQLESFLMQYSCSPYYILHGYRLYTLLTSMFIHFGLFHLVGNMYFLGIFGDNMEEVLGRKRFLVLYLVSGVVAALIQCLFIPSTSTVHMAGASGAISGVMGAYLIKYPSKKLKVLWGWSLLSISVSTYLILWLVMQVAFASLEVSGSVGGGVAFLANISGFMAGVVLYFLLRSERRERLLELIAEKKERERSDREWASMFRPERR